MKGTYAIVFSRFACLTLLACGVVVLVPQTAYAATVTTREAGSSTCTFTTPSGSSFGTYTVPVKTKTVYNNAASVGASQSAVMRVTLVIPAYFNDLIDQLGRSYNGTVNTMWVDNNLATPSPYDAASDNTITIRNALIPNDASSKLKFKIRDLGPFTYTGTGTNQAVAGDTTNGFLIFTLDVYADYNWTGPAIPFTATCGVPASSGGGPFVAATTTVS